MSEQGYRILKIWVLDLILKQQLMEEEKANRLCMAIGILLKTHRKG